jgi:dGTPase
MVRKLINLFVTDLIRTSNQLVSEAGVTCLQDVRECEQVLMRLSDEIQRKDLELKDFLYENMYRHYRVVRMSYKAQRVLRELWEAYVTHPDQLPPSTQTRIGDLSRERVVTDYLAGMTDRYALQEWDRLFNPWERP